MNKNKLIFILSLTILFFLSGCAAKGIYVKADSTQRELTRDYVDCVGLLAEVKNVLFRLELEHACLIGKGWDYVDEQGNPIKKY